MFRKESYLAINGFSNNYYGWGTEDDDLWRRTNLECKLRLFAFRFVGKQTAYEVVLIHADCSWGASAPCAQ
jgi:predicted glycosyltransferase involved in capsule biosynthesis